MNALRFSGFEVHGINLLGDSAVACEDQAADFFSVYGVLSDAVEVTRYVCIGDFDTREAAVHVIHLIPGAE